MSTGKKIGIIILVIILIGIGAFLIFSNKIVRDAEALTFENIRLEDMEDGDYQGSYEIMPVRVSVITSVKDGKIENIEITEYFHGKGEEAEVITDHIVEEQSLVVDNISGATVSSITIRKAVEDSLLTGD